MCDYCGRCESCCHCGYNVPRVQPPRTPTFHTAKRTERKENPSNRYLAVEIEVCGIRNGSASRGVADAVKSWGGAIVDDGSLPDGGFEINTAPASGDKFLQQLEEIGSALAQAGAWVDDRAGMHVHVDARDVRYYDMRRVVKLYAHLEKQLFRTCRASRRQFEAAGHYCLPCGELYARSLGAALTPKMSKARLLRNVYGHKVTAEFKTQKRSKHSEVRYHALNLHSWVYRGTVECRMYHGTVDAANAKAWGMLWAGLLDFAVKRSEREIDATIKATAPDALLLECAPTDPVRAWVREQWALFAADHCAADMREVEYAARHARAVRERVQSQRIFHEQQMQAVERYIGARPVWAIDFAHVDTPDGAVAYRWLGPDDVGDANGEV